MSGKEEGKRERRGLPRPELCRHKAVVTEISSKYFPPTTATPANATKGKVFP